MWCAIRHAVICCCAAGIVMGTARAEQQSFAALLTRAEMQAAAGHRWGPAGDNMTETVATLMDQISTATPEQLNRLAALLQSPPAGLVKDPAGENTVAAAPVAVVPGTAALGAAAVAGPVASGPVAAAPGAADRIQADDGVAAASAITPSVPGSIAPETATGRAGEAAAESHVPDRSPPERSPALNAAAAKLAPERLAPEKLAMGKWVSDQPRPPTAPEAGRLLFPPDSTAAGTPVAAGTPAPAYGSEPKHSTAKPASARLDVHPSARAEELLARGEQAERLGDLSAARRFYASSVQQGEPAAALRLGRLYDPAYLRQAALGGIDADPDQAKRWYERAAAMGNASAGPLLEALSER